MTCPRHPVGYFQSWDLTSGRVFYLLDTLAGCDQKVQTEFMCFSSAKVQPFMAFLAFLLQWLWAGAARLGLS